MAFATYNRNSVFVALMLSYIVILLLPVIFSSFLYGKLENIIEEDANRANLAMLDQVRQVVDNGLKEVGQLSVQISFNPKLQLLLSGSGEADDTEIYKFIDFVKDLAKYRNFSNFIYDFYVYLPDRDMVLSPDVKTTSRVFYDNIYTYEEMTYEAWKTMTVQTNRQTYVRSQPVRESSGTRNLITYMQPLPIGTQGSADGVLVILIEEQQFRHLLDNAEWDHPRNIYIFDKHNQIMMANTLAPFPFRELESALSGASGLQQSQIGGESTMVTYAASGQTGWKYVSLLPTDQFREKVNSVKLLAMNLLIFCLVVGIVAVYFLAYRNYSPIREVVDAIVTNTNAQRNKATNEYDFIKETLLAAVSNEKKQSELLSQQASVIRANFLSRLIRGFVDRSTIIPASLEFMNIRFVSEHFAIMLIEVDDCSEFIAYDTEEQWALVRYMLTNVIAEVVQPTNVAFVVELDRNRLAVLLNFREEHAPDGLMHMDEAAQACKHFIENRLKIYFTVGMSGVGQGIDRVGQLFREALQALDYKIVKGQRSIIHFHDIREVRQQYYYPIEIELQLINCIKTGDFAGSEKILEKIFEINFKAQPPIAPELGKCLFFNMIGTLVKILGGMNAEVKSIYGVHGDTYDFVKELSECQTVEEMYARIKEIYRMLCDSYRGHRNEHGERLMNRVRLYIDQRLGDPMLSLATIADDFGITPTYLSAFFKKQGGENITHYISKTRVEYAKKLLREETWTIAQIAQQVGYANDIGFIRVFKKYAGITPGKFREEARSYS